MLRTAFELLRSLLKRASGLGGALRRPPKNEASTALLTLLMLKTASRRVPQKPLKREANKLLRELLKRAVKELGESFGKDLLKVLVRDVRKDLSEECCGSV